VRYTVLAPWQAADPIDPTEPYLVRLFGGRAITVFFSNGPLSRAVSFEDATTRNADAFAAHLLPAQLDSEKTLRGEDQLLFVASDGELYGHHKRWRDRFLTRLVQGAAREQGSEVTTLGRYLLNHLAVREVRLHAPSAWSCEHGLARWSTGCPCTGGDPSWKNGLRRALDRLAAQLDGIFEDVTRTTLADPWAARDGCIGLHEGWSTTEELWARFGIGGRPPAAPATTDPTLQVLGAKYYGQSMNTSGGLFIEDLNQLGPRTTSPRPAASSVSSGRQRVATCRPTLSGI